MMFSAMSVAEDLSGLRGKSKFGRTVSRVYAVAAFILGRCAGPHPSPCPIQFRSHHRQRGRLTSINSPEHRQPPRHHPTRHGHRRTVSPATDKPGNTPPHIAGSREPQTQHRRHIRIGEIPLGQTPCGRDESSPHARIDAPWILATAEPRTPKPATTWPLQPASHSNEQEI
jgi:hypothetical protein